MPKLLKIRLMATTKDKIYKVHANILWQPVKQMRMGWEVIWAQSEFEDGSTTKTAFALPSQHGSSSRNNFNT